MIFAKRPQHFQVVRGEQDAFQDDVEFMVQGITHGLRNQADIEPVRDVVFAQDDAPEVVLLYPSDPAAEFLA